MIRKIKIYIAIIICILLKSIDTFGQIPLAPRDTFVVKGRLCVPTPDCKSEPTQFEDTLKAATGWRWSFGDSTAVVSGVKNPTHNYVSARNYVVTLIRNVGTRVDTLRRVVSIGNIPRPFEQWPHKDTPPDTVICMGEKIKLDPYPLLAPSGAKYLWFPKGDTTRVKEVDSTGCYSVQVTLPNGCSYEDRVFVKVCGQQPPPPDAKFFFGTKAGLDFQGQGNPTPISNNPPSNINTMEGAASAMDYKRKLQFYTDGVIIYDKNGNVMPSINGDTTSLAGSKGSTQSVAIIPKPICKGCEYQYYVFTTSEINGRKQLSYSVVDMRKNNGNGQIIEKNVPVYSPTTERLLTLKPESSDTLSWIISHDFGTNTFRVTKATEAGLTTSTYSVGLPHTTAIQGEGYMKLSGTDTSGVRQLAVVVPGPPRNVVQLFNFNETTGQISNPRTIDLGPAPPKAYGLEFSPDDSKLYVTKSGNGTAATPSELWQYDISLGDSTRIAESKIKIDSSNTQIFGALQLGPNGRIYMAVKGANSLGVINNPDEDSQNEVNFDLRGQTLGDGISQLGLSNMRRDEVDQEDVFFAIEYSDTCSTKPTKFTATPQCDPLKNTYQWTWGDGSAPQTASGPSTTHTYAKAGTYKVSLRQQILRSSGEVCKDTTISVNITIIATPDPFTLKNPIDTCTNVITINPTVQAESYLWTFNNRPIARTKTLQLTSAQSGAYELTAANGSRGQCTQKASTQVNIRRPPNITLRDTALCVGGGAVTIGVRELAWREFKWNTGATTKDIRVTQTGLYSVTVVDGNKCTNSDTVEVKAFPKPQIRTTLRQPTGCLARDGAITVNPTPTATTYQYRWINATSNATLASVTNTLNNIPQGKYRVYVSATANTCATDSLITLDAVSNIKVDTTTVPARCTQPRSGLISLSTLSGSPQKYFWTTSTGAAIGGSTPVLTNLAPGKYNVRITDDGGCETEVKDITVGMQKEKFVNLGPDRRKCKGDTILLDPRVIAVAGNTFAWASGETATRIVVKQAGTYSLTVNNTQTGCKDTDDIVVDFAPRPQYDFTKDMPICTPDGKTAALVVTPKSENLKYLWPHSGSVTPRVVVNKEGKYLVQIINPEGCTVTDTAKVFVACEPRIYVPDVFTPNNDQTNEKLKIWGEYYTDFELRIFNRWGELVFETNDINEAWNGSYRNIKYPSMVYPYTVTFGSKYYPKRPKMIQRGAILVITQ